LPDVVASCLRYVALDEDDDVAGSRNRPLSTALSGPWSVIVITIFPLTLSSRYTPGRNDETVCVLSTAPLLVSLICTCSDRPALSQSTRYSSRSCARPTVRETSTVKLVGASQAAAIEDPAPGTGRTRGSPLGCTPGT
jgi:hypothetical protein